MHTLIADPLTHFIAQVVAIVALSRLLGPGGAASRPADGDRRDAGRHPPGAVLARPLWPEVGAALFSPDSLTS
jgi:hypothetical protein